MLFHNIFDCPNWVEISPVKEKKEVKTKSQTNHCEYKFLFELYSNMYVSCIVYNVYVEHLLVYNKYWIIKIFQNKIYILKLKCLNSV